MVAVMDSSAEQDGSGWELHVDTAADGVRYGIEIWEPDSCVVVDDPGIRARLEAIGVRGPLA
ncbi:MAG: hypothetical protein S0880_00925 [Actinomycetota bacterium]|nr:hypothetical protein [Actinomycetota bacterium]